MSIISRSMSRRRRARGAGALVAAGLLLAAPACSAPGGGAEGVATGPGTASSTDIAYLNQAAASTNDIGTLKVAVESTVSGMPGVDDLTVTGSGEIDRGAHRAHLSMDAGGALGQVPGFDAADGTVESVVDGDTVYLRSALLARFAGLDEPWLSMSTADLADGEVPSNAGTSDPTTMLELLEQAGGTLTEEGREEVRGVDTRHVSTVIDLEKLAGRLDGPQKEAFDAAVQELGGDLDALVTIPAEAWIDDDGHVRRFSLTLDFGSGGGDVPELADVSVTVTYELYDFDVPVDIAVPNPDQVAPLDLSDLGLPGRGGPGGN